MAKKIIDVKKTFNLKGFQFKRIDSCENIFVSDFRNYEITIGFSERENECRFWMSLDDKEIDCPILETEHVYDVPVEQLTIDRISCYFEMFTFELKEFVEKRYKILKEQAEDINEIFYTINGCFIDDESDKDE